MTTSSLRFIYIVKETSTVYICDFIKWTTFFFFTKKFNLQERQHWVTTSKKRLHKVTLLSECAEYKRRLRLRRSKNPLNTTRDVRKCNSLSLLRMDLCERAEMNRSKITGDTSGVPAQALQPLVCHRLVFV